METEKNLFSRILKNDFGQGGAWPYYWGAIYRRNGRRTNDGQLYLTITRDFLRYGFHIGETGQEVRNRFLANCRRNQRELAAILEPVLAGDNYYFGKFEDEGAGPETSAAGEQSGSGGSSWRAWLENTDLYDFRVACFLAKDQVLTMEEDELIEGIRGQFGKLFPLILLTLSDDPMPAIKRYLNVTEAVHQTYSRADALADLFITGADLDDILNLLDHKKNIILQGPPGVGKTYAARRIAWARLGGGQGQ